MYAMKYTAVKKNELCREMNRNTDISNEAPIQTQSDR